MSSHVHNRRWSRVAAAVSALALAAIGSGSTGRAASDPDKMVDSIPTASPIKRVIIIVGENRSFDHLFATYKPKSRHETVRNLLSEGIVNADGTPGPKSAKAHQFKIVSAPNGDKFFISADLADKVRRWPSSTCSKATCRCSSSSRTNIR